MPRSSQRRRKNDCVYETVPNLKQQYFSPLKRTISDKQPAWSAPSKYQQTITQINPFRAIYHPDSEEENLDYEDEEGESYQDTPMPRKRRKITPQRPPPESGSERRSARLSVKSEPPWTVEDKEARKLQTPDVRPQVQKETEAALLMPPPKTPRTIRKQEIPSSQSPADSPLSTQSRKSIRDYSRSPLKERSTNIMAPPSSRRTSVRWATKLEVADSMENEENSQISTQASLPRLPRLGRYSDEIGSGKLCLSEYSGPNKEDTAKEIPDSSQQPSPSMRHLKPKKTRIEILDSDCELDDNYDDSDDHDDHDDNDNNDNEEDTHADEIHDPETMKEFLDEDQRVPSTGSRQPSLRSTTMDVSSTQHQTDLLPKQPKSQLINQSSLISNSHPRTTRKPHKPTPISSLHSDALQPHSSSSSQDPSAQLLHDLHRATQPGPGGLQTESQHENGFTTYAPLSSSPQIQVPSSPDLKSPARTTQNIQVPSSPLLQQSLARTTDLQMEESNTEEPMTIPTQLLPPHIPMPSTPTKSPFAHHTKPHHPIPPSQASTTDLTQTQYSPPKTLSSSSPPPPPMGIPSSPPPMPPNLSSSISPMGKRDWKNGSWKWDGVPLTESQLVPESLRDSDWVGWGGGIGGLQGDDDE